MFGWHPELVVWASVTLGASLVALIMGSLTFSVLPAPSTRGERARRWLLRRGFLALVGTGLVVGLLGLYVAL